MRPLVVVCSLFIVCLFIINLLNTEDQPVNIVDINALQNGDALGTKLVNSVTKRPFKNIQQSGSKSKFDGEAVKPIENALSDASINQHNERLSALDDATSADFFIPEEQVRLYHG